MFFLLQWLPEQHSNFMFTALVLHFLRIVNINFNDHVLPLRIQRRILYPFSPNLLTDCFFRLTTMVSSFIFR
ncbi:hypothetical protein CW304_13225 [Bacillus sp. UFRGS-B20]|nr:hypothetical protein CW304_13225 [Bacillus sp. UFRGS-B20]